MKLLETELKTVLDNLMPLLTETDVRHIRETTDAEMTWAIIGRLEPMLASYSTESMVLLDDIRAIPGTEELVRQMEDFEFERAIAELGKLKERLM